MTVILGRNNTVTPERAAMAGPAAPDVRGALHRLRDDYPTIPAIMIYSAIAGARADLPTAPVELLPELSERLAWYRLSTIRSLP